MYLLRDLGCFIAIGVLFITNPGWAEENHEHQSVSHVRATGVVTQVRSGFITLKTPFSLVMLNVNASERSGFPNVKIGDEFTVWKNDGNLVVDLHKKGHLLNHRLIHGSVVYTDALKTQLALSTPEGMQIVPVKMEEERLQRFHVGTTVTLELDETGRLTDMHRQ